MAIRNIVTRGFGPGATVGFVVTRGYVAGEAVATVSVAADYAVQSQGKGRKRRYFIEQDGRRLYGTRVELERLLERRAGTPPVSAPAVATPATRAAQAVLAPSEANDMARTAMGAAKAEFDRQRAARQYEDAVIALLLLN